MTWTKLLANKEGRKHKTSKKELDNMRALIARDLADAGLAGLSADRRFATSYNAVLQAANAPVLDRLLDYVVGDLHIVRTTRNSALPLIMRA